MRKYRGVVFDLFHTLTNFESRWSEHPPTSAVLGVDQAAWNHALWEQSRWRLIGEERDAVTIIRRLAHGIDATIPLELIESATQRRIDRFRHALTDIPPENITTLRTLKEAGFRLALISNADVIEAAGWADSPLAPLFDVSLLSCFAGCAKPDPEIYERCLHEMGLGAHDCMFVGDGGSDELRAARDAGLTTVLMSGVLEELWPEKIPARLPFADHHIRRIPELLALLA